MIKRIIDFIEEVHLRYHVIVVFFSELYWRLLHSVIAYNILLKYRLTILFFILFFTNYQSSMC